MKGMPLPFDFEGKGVLDLELVVKNKAFFTDSSYLFKKNSFLNNNCFLEPTSVLDSAKFPSRPGSSSTLSSSFGGSTGGGGGCGGAASTDTAAVNPSTKWHLQDSTTATSSNVGAADSELLPVPPSLTGGDKCAMEDWESVLSESADVSPEQEQSVFGWILGDVEDPAVSNLNKFLQIGGGGGGSVNPTAEFEFSGGGFGDVDQGFGVGDQFNVNLLSHSAIPSNFTNFNRSTSEKIDSLYPANNILKFPPQNMNPNNVGPTALHHQITFDSSADVKPPPIFNPQLLINQRQAHQTQNLPFFKPYEQHQGKNSLFASPPAKRHNPGGQISRDSILDTGQQSFPHQQLLPHYLHQKLKMDGGDEFGQIHQQQQGIIDQLYKAAELVQTDNPILAQGILARLNHQLSSIGNPFQRAAFYFKEALQSLLQTDNLMNPSVTASSPFSLIFKISAYKSFSEFSPLVQFANFTCTQALIEALERFDRIHVVDFDVGFGGQWASLMQELALRIGGAPSLKITALASPSSHDQLELYLVRENLIQFASELNISFEFDIMSIDALNSCSWSLPYHTSGNEGVAVNLPVGFLANHQSSVPMVLCFIKNLSPKIVVSLERGCYSTNLPFASYIIHALQSNMNLLESLDAANINMDALQKIERFLIQPGIEKNVMGRFRYNEKTQHWRNLLMSSGFSPVNFSNFTESQADCVVKRTPVRGFQVERREHSFVLCWQHKELISISAWIC